MRIKRNAITFLIYEIMLSIVKDEYLNTFICLRCWLFYHTQVTADILQLKLDVYLQTINLCVLYIHRNAFFNIYETQLSSFRKLNHAILMSRKALYALTIILTICLKTRKNKTRNYIFINDNICYNKQIQWV